MLLSSSAAFVASITSLYVVISTSYMIAHISGLGSRGPATVINAVPFPSVVKSSLFSDLSL